MISWVIMDNIFQIFHHKQKMMLQCTWNKYLIHNSFTQDVSIQVYWLPKPTMTNSLILNATQAISQPSLALRSQGIHSPKSLPGLTP